MVIKKPRVDHLRVFGCIGHVKQIGPSITKLSDRSVKMVMIGYEEGTKGYRMLNSVLRTLHISRDVIFEEDQGGDWAGSVTVQDKPGQFEIELPVIVDNPTTTQEADSKPASLAVGFPEPVSSQQTPGGSLGYNSPQTPATNTPSGASSIDWVTPIQGQSADSEGVPQRFRTLTDLFDHTDVIEDYEYSGVCMLAADDPMSVEDALNKNCW